MTKINRSNDCGNSPKQKFVEEITIAVALGDRDFLFDSVTDDIIWQRAGSETVAGKEAFAAALEKNAKASSVTIHHVVSHGKKGAANGTIDVDGARSIAFCCVYEFNNTKCTAVKEMTTYFVE